MTKIAVCFVFSAFFTLTVFLSLGWSQKADPTIIDFKVQAMYRAAKLTWKAKDGFKGENAVQILRSETFEEGPYKEVGVVNLTSGKNAYDFVDKSMGTEAKYYYKLVVKETDESFGPISTRPYFSPPATHHQPLVPREQGNPVLSLFLLTSKS